MSENGSIENNGIGNPSENTGEEIPDVCVLTQEAVNGQMKGFIAPLIRQLDELFGLVEGIMTTPYLSHSPRADYSAISGAVVHQLDTKRIVSNVKTRLCQKS